MEGDCRKVDVWKDGRWIGGGGHDRYGLNSGTLGMKLWEGRKLAMPKGGVESGEVTSWRDRMGDRAMHASWSKTRRSMRDKRRGSRSITSTWRSRCVTVRTDALEWRICGIYRSHRCPADREP
jgi:hypothetical protein